MEVNGDRRRVSRASIKELYRERRRLIMAINRQDGGGVRYGVPGGQELSREVAKNALPEPKTN